MFTHRFTTWRFTLDIKIIWSQYQASLKAFLHSKIANPSDVDDLMQDILIKTHQHLYAVKEPSKIKSWIFQIANNTVIDFYRKSHASQNVEVGSLWYEQEQTQVITELAGCVKPFINALPQDEAALLTAIEIEGISQKEYAQSHDINYSTLKSRVIKSRKKLHQIFNHCCSFNIDSQGNLLDVTPKNNTCLKC